MDFTQFRQRILSVPTPQLLGDWFRSLDVASFDSATSYQRFRQSVMDQFPRATNVHVVGTANWKYSLNPNKDFKSFDEASDIDTVIVDPESFSECWDEIRKKDRLTKYTRAPEDERQYNSASNSIYCGFVAPVWVLDRTTPMRYEFRARLNKVSRSAASGREVKGLFFRTDVEVMDYYTRGVMAAKVKLK